MKLTNKIFLAFVFLLNAEAFADVFFEPSDNVSQAAVIELDNKTQTLEGTLTLQQDWVLSGATITLKGALKTNGHNVTLTNSKLSVTELNSHQESELTLTNSIFIVPVSSVAHAYVWNKVSLSDKSSIQSHISDQVDQGLNWQANQIAVDETSGFDVSAKSSYIAPSANSFGVVVGSHAGRGAYFGSEPYGSLTAPYTQGSATYYPYPYGEDHIGLGGGVLKLVTNQLQLDGYLRANGSFYTNDDISLGAAGGSIWLDVNILSGGGRIQANAGVDDDYVGGGGGRVAVYANNLSGFDIAHIEATNGLAAGDNRIVEFVGGVGTVHIENKTTGEKTLKLVNHGGVLSNQITEVGDLSDYTQVITFNANFNSVLEGTISLQQDWVLKDASIKLMGMLKTNGYSITLINSKLSVAELNSHQNSNLTLANSTFTAPVSTLDHIYHWQIITLRDKSSIQSQVSNLVDHGLNWQADQVMVDETSGFDVSAKSSYLASQINSWGTGSHAGRGAYYSGDSYGLLTAPYTQGGAAPYYDYDEYMGYGGGALRLRVNQLQLDGYLRANGSYSIASVYGAAGGSIWLDVDTLSGTGQIQANAGVYPDDFHSYTGGGGRVAVYANVLSGFDLNRIEATNGLAAEDERSASYVGGVGTVHIENKITGEKILRLVNHSSVMSNQITDVEELSDYTQIIASNANVNSSGQIQINRTLNISGNKFEFAGDLSLEQDWILKDATITLNGALVTNGYDIVLIDSKLSIAELNSHQNSNLTLTNSTFTTPVSALDHVYPWRNITLSDKSFIQSHIGNLVDHGLNWQADRLVVDETSGFDVSATSSYIASQTNSRGTGSHAGRGAYYNSGDSYGSLTAPYTQGSAAPYYDYDEDIGYGGGALKLTVSQLQLDGYLRANGSYYSSYGAAGGSIWLDVGTLSGTGQIQANAGVYPAGLYNYTGGGGRVAVYANDLSGFDINRIEATNGLAAEDDRSASYVGGVGTVHIENKITGEKTLRLVNHSSVMSNQITDVGGVFGYTQIIVSNVNLNVTLEGAQSLQQDWALSGATITLNGELKTNGYNIRLTNSKLSVSELSSHQDSELTLTNSTFTVPVSALDHVYPWRNITLSDKSSIQSHISNLVDHGLNWQADRIVVDESSGFDVSAKSSYTVPRMNTWVTGSHAGRGSYNGNEPYGSLTDPYTQGSATNYNGGNLGYGGGVLKLTVNQLQLDGYLRANGSYYSSYGAAGGSIWLDVSALSGTGQIQTNAGVGSSYTGGGGRVAVYANDLSGFDINRIEATNGLAAGDTRRVDYVGGVGTVHIENKTTGEKTLRLVNNGGLLSNQITDVGDLSDYTQIIASNANFNSTGNTQIDGSVDFDGAKLTLEGTLSLEQDWVLSDANITLKGLLKTNGYNVTLINSKLSVTELNSHQDSELTLTNSTFTAPVSTLEHIYRWQNITLSDKSSIQSHISDQVDQGLNWQVNQVVVDETSGFDVSAKSSYIVPRTNAWVTGSHAGRGAYFGNEPYGSLTDPYTQGSAAHYNGGNLGYGGGALKLTVNQLQLDGYLRANGSYYSSYGAAGAGGSIWLDVDALSGAGQIQANAGVYPSGLYSYTGGGGRVAVYANDLSGFDINRIEATNGLAAGDNRSVGYVGGVGTVHVENKTTGKKTLRLVNNGGLLSNQTTQIRDSADYQLILDNAVVNFLDSVALQSNAAITNSRVTFEGNFLPQEFSLEITNSELTVSGQMLGSGGNIALDKSKLTWPVTTLEAPHYWQAIKVENGSVLTHQEMDSYPLGINIVAHSFLIDESSKVDVNSKGRLGLDKTRYSGGSYGALGGNAGVEPYGEDYAPFGGGTGGDPSYKTRGGGSFKLTAATMQIDGQISANGMAHNYSGGSGGSIWLSAGNLAGSGDINADGASGSYYSYSGGGSGGRVAVYYAQSQGSLINRLSVKGAANAGQTGTVYTNQRQLAVLVSSTTPSNAGYVIESLDSFTVRFYQPIDLNTFTSEDIRINSVVSNNLTISQLSATEFLVTLATPITQIDTHEIVIGPHIASLNGALMDQNQNGITAEEADAYRFFIEVKKQQKLVNKDIAISGENNTLEDMQVIVDGAVVTASGDIKLDSLELINGAKLVVVSGKALQLTVNDLKVSKNSIINASGKGNKGVHGLAGQGGSYAGSGGTTVKNPATANYYTTRGSYTHPEDLGEGGLDFLAAPSYSSFGGGAIHIITKSLIIDGQILSNGDDTEVGTTGAGSGGSVLIKTETIEGMGRIDARGGYSNFAGNGSGGRVAIYYRDNNGFDFSQNVSVSGGGQVIYPVTSSYGNLGAAGSLYLKNTDTDHETLVFMHDYHASSMGGNSVSANVDVIQFANAKADLLNLRTQELISQSSFLENNENSSVVLDSFDISLTTIQASKAWGISNGIMQIDKGNTLLLKGKTQWTSLIIEEGATLSVPEYQENDPVPYLIAQELEIKKGAKADLSFKGKSGDISKKNIAGSLGGYGAYLPTSHKNPLPLVGSRYSPYEWGVGGSGVTQVYRGGGSLRVSTETLKLEGTINAQGADLSSGGSVWIDTNYLEGKGSVSANGGAGGGGGRVALYYANSDFPLANISANKGGDRCIVERAACLTGLVAHSDGTVYIADKSVAPQVIAPTFKAIQPTDTFTIVFSNAINHETVTSDALELQCNSQWLMVNDIVSLSPNELELSFTETLPLGECTLSIAPSISNSSGLALEKEYVHSFVVDDTPPQTLTITSDTLLEMNYRRSKTFTITGEKGAGNDVFVDGQLADSLSETEWSINLYREHGIYSLEIYEQDAAGNRSDNLYLDMQIDTEKPQIQFSLSSYIKNNNGEFTFRYRDTDSQINEDSLVYSLLLNGEPVKISHEPLQESSGYAGILLKSENPLEDGRYEITITIADKADNKSEIAREFTVDTVAPQNFSLTQDYFESVAQQIKISGTSELDSYVYITVKGTSTYTYQTGWLNNIDWSLNINLWEGENTITVVATDRAGNQTQPLIAKAIYDNSPPGEVSPVVNAKGSGKEINLDWSHYSEKDNGGDISYYRIYQSENAFTSINDASVKMISRRQNSYKSFNVTELERDKDYYFAVVAEDNFGHYLTTVASIKVTPEDIIAPVKPKVQVIKSQSNTITLRVTPPEEEDLQGITVGLGDTTVTVAEYPQGFADIVFNNLQQSESYPVSAISFDSANNQSEPLQLTAFTLLTSPTIVSAEIREGKAYLAWQESMPELNAGQIRIFIEPERFISVENLSPRMTLPTGNLQAVASGLSGNTTYYIALVAVNAHGAFHFGVNAVEVATEKDIEGPEVNSITYNGKNIADGSELTESGIVTAVLYDKSGIGRIDLSIDETILDSRYGTNGSYQYALNLENISDGVHTFKVVAKDTLENETVVQAQVVVNFKAPEAPILLGSSRSTGEAFYQVSGKADPKALISLYNNEQLIIENLPSNNGAFSYSLSLKEGSNKITAFARYPDRNKQSMVSNSLIITLDSSVPKAPAILNAQTLDSGRVVLTWPAVSGEDVVGYQLYRSAEPIMSIEQATPLFSKLGNATKHEDLPMTDGHYYYAVAAFNNVGTPSDLAHANAMSDRQGPVINIDYDTNGAFENATQTYGRGVLTIKLTSDENLRTMPYLSLTAEGGVPQNIALQASLGMENTYEGTLELTDKLMSGTYWAVVGAYDQYGNRAGEVASGAFIKIDTQGPMIVSLNTTPDTPIQNSSEGREISIMFVLDEESADTEFPLLIPGVLSTYGEFIVLSGFEGGISANKEESHWVAGMTLPAELAAEETETLYFKVITQDKLGNKREAWIEKSGVEIYQGELPALRSPNGLIANAMAAGKVQLSWNEVSNASAYRIYRAETGRDSYTLIKEQALFEYIDGVDNLLNDGNYQYYVTAVRSGNNQQSESFPSNVVQVTADSISPAIPQAVNVDLASNGVHVVWERINEDATYNLYRAATSLEGSVSLEQVVLVGSRITFASTMDISPNSDEPYYYVTAIDKAGNESDLSEAAYLNASLLPVSKLHAVKDAEGEITLSWQHKGQNGLKYQIIRTINGVTEVLASTEGLNYQDRIESQYPVDITYSVTAIDRNNVSSLEHSITIPAISIKALENIVLQRGVMNKVLFRVDSLDGSSVKQAQLKVGVELNEETKTHLSERFSVESGAYATAAVVIAGYSDLEDYENLLLTLESEPQAGDSLRIHTQLPALASDNGLLIELTTEQAVKGASAVLKATITNPGSAPVEVVTAESRGAKPSSSLWVYLETEDGEVIAKTPVNISTGKVINLSSGHSVFRAEAGSREEMPPINIDIPGNAPDKLVIRLQANTIHYHLGYADHAEMRGSTAAVRVNTETTPYRVEVTAVSATHISAGEKFSIEGRIIADRLNEPLNNRDVKIIISINGFDKVRTIKTDGSGLFNYEHQTDEDISGEYLVSVVHPLVNEKPIMARVSTERLAVTPTRMNVKVPYNYIATPSFKLSASELFNNRQLVVEVSDETPLPEGLTIKLPESLSISGGKSLMLPVELSATEQASTVGMLLLELKDTDGQFYSYIRIEYQFSKVAGAITFSKNYIETGLALGGSVQESIQLKNTGFTDLRDIQLSVEPLEGYSLPNWIAIAQQNIALLPIGGSTQTDIMITPDSGVSEGVHAFKLQATSAANGLVQSIPVYINVTQSGVGNAFFHVVDFYTGTLDKNNAIIPGLAGAKITLQNELVLSEEYELKTDQFGDAFFDSIPAGRYYYRISAFDHSSSSGRVWVKPGTTSSERVLLQNTLVSVEFSVKEIALQDKYDILLEARYETNVPAPVVVMNPLSINLPNMKRGEVFQGEFTLTNHGLIEAQEMRAMLPKGDQYAQFEFLRQVPSVLSAGEVFVMPYRVIALKNFDNSEDNMSGIASLLGRELTTAGCYSHQYSNRIDYKFECAAGDPGTGSITQVYHSSGGSCGGGSVSNGAGNYSGSYGGSNSGSYSTSKPKELGYWMCVQDDDNDDNPDTDC